MLRYENVNVTLRYEGLSLCSLKGVAIAFVFVFVFVNYLSDLLLTH